MAVITLDKDGNRVVLQRGQTLEQKVKTIKSENIVKGIKNPECIKDILATKNKLKEDEVL